MFFALLMATLVGALVHYRFGPAPAGGRTRGRLGELLLVWVLVGYCGIPMVGVAAGALVWPEPTAAMLNLPTGGVFQAFMAGAYLGMSVIAALAWRWRGAYLIGPALAWSIFFLLATYIHVHVVPHGVSGHVGLLAILTNHTLVSVVLLTGLGLGGARMR